MGLLSIPKTYKPRKGAPKESLIYASKAEQGLLRRMTDGKSTMTKHGIPSFYMEGSSTGNYRDSSPSQTSTRSSPSAPRDSGMRDSVGANAPSRSTTSRDTSRDSGMRDRVGANTPSRSAPVDRGYNSNPRAAEGRYGRVSSPVERTANNNWADVQRQAAAVRGLLGQQRSVSPQYDGPARYNQPFNANRSQQTFGGYPNSMAGMMPGQLNGFAAPVNPMAPQANPSTFPARPAAIAQNNVYSPPEVSAMKRARQSTFPARPGVIAENNVYSPPEVSAIKREREFASTFPARPESAWSNIADIADAPIPRQNPLRDLSKIRTDNTFNAATDFGTIEGATLSRLAALQEKYGKPITVTEGTAPLNTHVKRSAHHINPRTGKSSALDLGVPTEDRATVAQLADQVGFGGLGAYKTHPNMVHVDSGKLRSWGPNGRYANIGQLGDPALQAALTNRTPQINTANAPAPPKATVMRNVVAPAIQGIRNMVSPPSIPKPQPNPMRNRTASINPAVAPPQPQQAAPAPQGESWFGNLSNKVGEAASSAYAQYTDANQKINALGGGEKVQKLARTAQAIMDVLGGSGGRPSGRGDFGKGGNRDNNSSRVPGGPNSSSPPAVPPVAAPPVNPMSPWYYPEYTQTAWAQLPTGIGGYARG